MSAMSNAPMSIMSFLQLVLKQYPAPKPTSGGAALDVCVDVWTEGKRAALQDAAFFHTGRGTED